MLEESDNSAANGAADFRFTTQTVPPPEVMDVSEQSKEESSGSASPSARRTRVVTVELFSVALRSTSTAASSDWDAITVKDWNFAPTGTCTEAGTMRPELLEVRVGATAVSAGSLRYTVHVPESPGFNCDGAQAMDVSTAGAAFGVGATTLKVEDLEVPPRIADKMIC